MAKKALDVATEDNEEKGTWEKIKLVIKKSDSDKWWMLMKGMWCMRLCRKNGKIKKINYFLSKFFHFVHDSRIFFEFLYCLICRGI